MWNEWLRAGTVEWVHFHRLVILEIAVKLAEDHLSVWLEGSQLRLVIASVSDGGGTSVLRCWPSDTLPRETYWVLIRCQRVYTGFVLCSAATRSSDTEEGVKAPPVPVTHFMEHFPLEQTWDDTLCSAQPS